MGKIVAILLIISCVTSFKIQPILEPGLFFDHLGSLMIQRGSWHTALHTRVFPENDSNIIIQLRNKLNNVLNNETDPKTIHLKLALDDECDYVLNLIRDCVKTRAKRSRGVFRFLGDFLFGGDEFDEQLSLLKSTEDQKIARLSENLDDTNKAHKKIMDQIGNKISHINEGITLLQREFSEDKLNRFNKYVEETILRSNTLIQQITLKYQTLKHDPLTLLEGHVDTIQGVTDMTLAQPYLERKEIVKGEVVLHITHIVIGTEQFEIFNVIPTPNSNDNVIMSIEETTIAVNDDNNYIYPHNIKKINKTHYLSSKTQIRKGPDCIVAALLHRNTTKPCLTSALNPPYLNFTLLNQPNKILYYTSHPQSIRLNCNGTITNPTNKVAIITLSPPCKIETEDIEIRPVIVKNDETYKTFYKPMRNLPFETTAKGSQNKQYGYIVIICLMTLISIIPFTVLVIIYNKKRSIPRPPRFRSNL